MVTICEISHGILLHQRVKIYYHSCKLRLICELNVKQIL